MNQNLLKWYAENGFPQTVIDAAQTIISRVQKYYEVEFDEVFISNAMNDGHEDYTSLWMLTDEDATECKLFLTRFDIDIVRYKGRVRYINIITDRSDTMNCPTQNSKMKLSISLTDDIRCQFEAAGLNCANLSRIAKRYLKEYKSK